MKTDPTVLQNIIGKNFESLKRSVKKKNGIFFQTKQLNNRNVAKLSLQIDCMFYLLTWACVE